MIYYTWAVNGFSLFFQDIRQNPEVKLDYYYSGMIVLTGLNIVDIVRAVSAFLSFVLMHFLCLFKARRFRTTG